jgi:GGDEF domain-containing protein
MEVNKTEAIAVTSRDGKRTPGHQHADDHDHEDDGAPRDEGARRDAFQMDGVLDSTISPEIQRMLSDLAGQIEPLRKDIERAQARERDLRDRLERHPYLPVLNRQGLEHELSRVVGHIQGLGSATFMCISVINAEQIRRERGRDIYEEAMAHACKLVGDLLSNVDIIGCLGGHDLGILLLAPENNPVDDLNARLQSTLSQHLFTCNNSAFPLQVAIGGVPLHQGHTFAQALKAADADLKERQGN